MVVAVRELRRKRRMINRENTNDQSHRVDANNQGDETLSLNIDALYRMAEGEDVTPSQHGLVTSRPSRPSRKERMFPGEARIDFKVRNHI